ncbi:MAG: hypothetical protein OXJ90_14870 [Spirochaetaceae bacterium]|nr:hypothetical protein [Spirochaetaceae bacterium]
MARPRPWRHEPDLRAFAAGLPEFNDQQVAEWAGEFTSDAVAANELVLRSKAALLSLVSWCVAASAVSLVGLSILVNT